MNSDPTTELPRLPVVPDDKGRMPAEHLTDRELLIELVKGQRALADALSAAAQNPMLKALLPNVQI